MFPLRLTLSWYGRLSFISWLVIAVLLGHVESSKDRKKAQRVLEHQAKDLYHVKEHLMEQLGMDDEAATKYLNETRSEVQFFLMHDFDNNNKLDGLEIFQGFSHHDHSEDEGHHESDSFNEDDMAEFVDTILEDQDRNDDGYIDYPEFMASFKHTQARPIDDTRTGI
ncbi:multiple coagulation factor deficiency protein 2-like [Orbicella faveolata]|uniref:multiple coagulation factor deficiency protein 2-like n=1 Tax=Orbicella faveolata TaxID=48498 RepID=UPI0009E61F16|nr:multiple coagulation factor deficiency protein 2-like [Orbicella faveolata]